MSTGRDQPAISSARPVDLAGFWNASDADIGDRFHPLYRPAVARLPDGPSVFRGLPFDLGTRTAGRRWILVERELAIDLSPRERATHLVIAHFADSWRDANGDRPPGMPAGWVFPTGELLARYEIELADGRTIELDIRRRVEIADGIIGWGFLPFAAIGHRTDETLDWRGPYPRQVGGRYAPAGHGGALTVLPGSWGASQTGVADAVPSPDDDVTYWLHAVALPPDAVPVRLHVTPLGDGRPGTSIVIAGLSLFDGTADPLVLSARRQVLIEGAGGAVPEVDLGVVIQVRPADARPAGRTLDAGPIGWGSREPGATDAPEAGADGSPVVVDIAMAPDATISVGGWRVAAADLVAPLRDPGGTVSIEPLAPADVRVEVRISADGQVAPSRVRFVAADGRYLPPLGHREEINPATFEDTGAGLILGGDTYAYVPGAFSIDLPPGVVEVEVVKGFDHRPIRMAIVVDETTHELELELERAIDLRAAGWVTADPHVHFLAPSTALLQAAAEDVTLVHLLATQLGDEFTNVTDLWSGDLTAPDGRQIVLLGTENRQNMLGHLALLGARRPVLPMASGGAPEGRVGAAVMELLADWADRCHADGGLVVGAHFPLPLAEIAADIVAGRIDAIEMQTFAPGLDNPTVLEWYRFLNCGYRLPVLGGTDKMSAEMALGGVRTYARLEPGQPPSFEAWAAAVRAGRTQASSGPVLELTVDGREPGDVLRLPAAGGRLEVRVKARASQPIISVVELVMNGRVVAYEAAPTPVDRLDLTTAIDVDGGAWIAARARSPFEIGSAYLTSMAAHTSPVYVEVPDRPVFLPGDAAAIGEVIDGTARWLGTMATITDPAERRRMVERIEASSEPAPPTGRPHPTRRFADVKIALDPYMLRDRPFGEVCRIAAEIGYDSIELSPRPDFIPFFTHPRADRAKVAEFRAALSDTGLELASILPLYRWSSPDEDERLAAVRYWKRAIQLCVDVGCRTMNSEFNGRPEQAARSEAQFWRSMEELLPIFEREGIRLNLEAHPDDFIEQNTPAVDLVRGIDSPGVGYVFCMPHTYYLGDDIAAMIRYAEPVLAQVHVADVLNHRASSGLRYIVNPPGSTARVHQHLDIGQGEVDFGAGFDALRAIGFDGIVTSCVFAWEERAIESSQLMYERITALLGQPAGG